MSKSKEELCAMKARDLMRLATSLGIKGSWDMKKADVVEAILQVTHKAEPQLGAEDQRKVTYIESAAMGTLVAFKLPSGKVKSAAIIKRASASRMLMLETSYGARFVVSYDDVLWVRTGKLWPKGVYQLLKGQVTSSDAEGKK